jgi:hypothetical protein
MSRIHTDQTPGSLTFAAAHRHRRGPGRHRTRQRGGLGGDTDGDPRRVSVLASFLWMPYYPIWSLTVVAFDVFVIWALVSHGRVLAQV